MAFGIYVHIPYCIQRCSYCDFATYEKGKILPPAEYIQILFKEIEQRSHFFKPTTLDTLYFGGGTPSLLDADLIVSVIRKLAKHGFQIGPNTEVTIEINPATVSEEKLKVYLDHGVNRFSVGAQTFDDKLLKMVKREHNAKQTLETLALLSKYHLNFSFDILFALPTQTLEGLKHDVNMALNLGARHLSPYCLTVPDGHPLSKGRAIEDDQVEMFNYISQSLESAEYKQYEISNFAKSGFESRHNLLYWTDEPWWGIGLSAHSYSKHSTWGTRFWNANNINDYQTQILNEQHSLESVENFLPDSQFELLEKHQALTDFCHTSMRLLKGLDLVKLEEKFGAHAKGKVQEALQSQSISSLVHKTSNHWKLTPQGVVLSNLVFEKLLFSRDEVN